MLHTRTMTAADVDLGMRLKAQAGWNQTPADWRRMLLMQSDGCFVAELNGLAAGTAVACIFDKIAWIAMVLVDASVRGRGIGKALMQHALAFADAQGILSVRLDATPLGQPLYEKLGFVPQYSLTRFTGRLGERPAGEAADQIKPAQASDAGRILALDGEVTRTDRSKFLLRLLREQSCRAYVTQPADSLLGFVIRRPGSNAWQLGPCIADAEVGEAMLDRACGQLAGETVLVDVPEPNLRAIQWATQSGLQSQRRLLRMCRGAVVIEDLSRLWASSGPELG